jgi:hypothetical protein
MQPHSRTARISSLLHFAGLVTPAAQEFINFTSNQSTEHPSSYLNRDILKTFISVDGPDDAHVWHPGQEKIPQN